MTYERRLSASVYRPAIVTICLAFSACTGYARTEPSPSLTDQRVRVRFRAPVSLMVLRTNGDSALLARVVEVTGRAVSVTSDSLRLVIWTASAAHGVDLHAPANSRVAISRADVMSVEQWKIDERRSKHTILALGAAAIVGAVLFAVYLAALLGAD